jgi:ribosomal-protein-alanine N-acetyltransferase
MTQDDRGADWSISNATSADLPAVVELERLTFDHPWTLRDFEIELRLPRSHLKLLRRRVGGPLGGFISYWIIEDEIQLMKVATDPRAQRRGIARTLIEEMIAEGRRRGAHRVTLEVRPSNRAARSLYRDLGFVEVGRRPRYYRDGEDALLLDLELD